MGYHGEPSQSREGYGANKAEAERVLFAQGRGDSYQLPVHYAQDGNGV